VVGVLAGDHTLRRAGSTVRRVVLDGELPADSTDSVAARGEEGALDPAGASSTNFAANSTACGWATVQFVVNGSRAICAAATAPISSP